MEDTHECRACGRKFNPDPRNRSRQMYCRRRDCQRQPRTLGQRLRRGRATSDPAPAQRPATARRLQAASDISKADLRQESPVIIGLISMITGITDLRSLQKVYRQCWLRGLQILSASTTLTAQNPALISLLQQVGEQSHSMG